MKAVAGRSASRPLLKPTDTRQARATESPQRRRTRRDAFIKNPQTRQSSVKGIDDYDQSTEPVDKAVDTLSGRVRSISRLLTFCDLPQKEAAGIRLNVLGFARNWLIWPKIYGRIVLSDSYQTHPLPCE